MATQEERSGLASLIASETVAWDHWAVKPEDRVLEIGTPPRRIRVQEVGTGPPVLLVHGTGGYGPYWAPLIAGLGDYRCVMIDRPGWGGSDPVDYRPSSYREIVADLMAQILDELGIERVHSVGASIGDSWALALAVRHPDRVRSVTLLGGGPLTDEVEIPLSIRLLRSPLGVVMSRVPWRRKMETSQARQVGHGPALDDGRMPGIYVDWKVEMTNSTDWRRNERDMVRAITESRHWKPGLTFSADDLASVAVPLLMVLGSADPIAPVGTWRSFVSRIPAGRLEVLEDAGHLPWFDDPERVAGLLKGHFREAAG